MTTDEHDGVRQSSTRSTRIMGGNSLFQEVRTPTEA